MNTPLRITYELVGTGWSACTIEAGDSRAELSGSYLSNALGNLVLSAVAVMSGFRTLEFGFDEEPGEYRWSIESTDMNAIRVRVLEFQELWGNTPTESGKLHLETITMPLIYAKAVYAAAASVLANHGLQGYAEKWAEHPFPERELALLGEAISARERAA